MDIPPNTEWALYFDVNGDLIDVEQRDPETGQMEQTSIKYNVVKTPLPSDYQFLGAKPLGEWYFYRSGSTTHGYYHRYNCDLRCR
jgi:hypothetical protein